MEEERFFPAISKSPFHRIKYAINTIIPAYETARHLAHLTHSLSSNKGHKYFTPFSMIKEETAKQIYENLKTGKYSPKDFEGMYKCTYYSPFSVCNKVKGTQEKNIYKIYDIGPFSEERGLDKLYQSICSLVCNTKIKPPSVIEFPINKYGAEVGSWIRDFSNRILGFNITYDEEKLIEFTYISKTSTDDKFTKYFLDNYIRNNLENHHSVWQICDALSKDKNLGKQVLNRALPSTNPEENIYEWDDKTKVLKFPLINLTIEPRSCLRINFNYGLTRGVIDTEDLVDKKNSIDKKVLIGFSRRLLRGIKLITPRDLESTFNSLPIPEIYSDKIIRREKDCIYTVLSNNEEIDLDNDNKAYILMATNRKSGKTNLLSRITAPNPNYKIDLKSWSEEDIFQLFSKVKDETKGKQIRVETNEWVWDHNFKYEGELAKLSSEIFPVGFFVVGSETRLIQKIKNVINKLQEEYTEPLFIKAINQNTGKDSIIHPDNVKPYEILGFSSWMDPPGPWADKYNKILKKIKGIQLPKKLIDEMNKKVLESRGYIDMNYLLDGISPKTSELEKLRPKEIGRVVETTTNYVYRCKRDDNLKIDSRFLKEVKTNIINRLYNERSAYKNIDSKEIREKLETHTPQSLQGIIVGGGFTLFGRLRQNLNRKKRIKTIEKIPSENIAHIFQNIYNHETLTEAAVNSIIKERRKKDYR